MPRGTPYIQPAQNTDQCTPRDLFDALWEEHGGFDLDPCGTPDQYTAQRVLDNGGWIYIPQPVEDEVLVDAPEPHIKIDGLVQPWHGKVYMNPPYGLALRKWVPKAVHEVGCGNAELVVALLPAKTDTIWWQKYVLTQVTEEGYECYECESYPMKPTEIRFIKGRLTFEGFSAPAGHASAIVVWRR